MSWHYLCIVSLGGLWEGMGLFWLWIAILQFTDAVANSLYTLQHHIRKQYNNYFTHLNHPVFTARESFSDFEKTEMYITTVMVSTISYNSRQKQHSSSIQTRKTFRGKLAGQRSLEGLLSRLLLHKFCVHKNTSYSCIRMQFIVLVLILMKSAGYCRPGQLSWK